MTTRLLPLLTIIAILLSVDGARSQDQTPPQPPAAVAAIITRVKIKVNEGKRSESDYAAELKELDSLLASHKGETNSDVNYMLGIKATLFIQVFDNPDRTVAVLKQIQTDFPGTLIAKKVPAFISQLNEQIEMKKKSAPLVAGSKFPDFNETDVNGRHLSISDYAGKVVLLDFWATWCPPCRAELPNVKAIYEKYHEKGFEIIGISLDQDRDKLVGFTKENSMPWQQYFDGKGWDNKLSSKYGVGSIPMTYLLDGHGMILGSSLRGDDLQAAVAKALGLN